MPYAPVAQSRASAFCLRKVGASNTPSGTNAPCSSAAAEVLFEEGLEVQQPRTSRMEAFPFSCKQ